MQKTKFPILLEKSYCFIVTDGPYIKYVIYNINCQRKNAFNKINSVVILWTVCHPWSPGDHFLNCYHHWLFLILKNMIGAASFLHSMEFLTQGDTIFMVPYGIVVLLMIK